MEDDDLIALRLAALGHPVRLQIVRTLASRGTCVCGDLVELFPLAQATVSQHLKVLKDAGLVRGTIAGRNRCYCLDPAAFTALGLELTGIVRPLVTPLATLETTS